MRRLGPATLAALAATVIGAPAALATTQTASSGDVTATFFYKGKVPNYSHLRLTITRAGTAVYDQEVTDRRTCGTLCWPASTKSSLRVLDLDGNGEPEVVLSLYTGGANCCYVDQVFAFHPGPNAYTKASWNFGDFGVAIKQLGGGPRFVGANYAFKYAFTDGADSGEPIQIVKFSLASSNGPTSAMIPPLTDDTRSYPALIARDAKRWLRFFKHDLKNGVGVLAAWAADEDLLGHEKLVSSYLQQQLKAGHLNSAAGPKYSGKNFITKLRKFLKQFGYLP
jgi:hypothetical protein